MQLRVTKRRVCGFTSDTEAENQKGHIEETAIEGFLYIQNLGNVYKLIYAFHKINSFLEHYA